MNRAILKLNSNELHFVRYNIDLEITQQVAPSIFSFQENISKSLIHRLRPNFEIGSLVGRNKNAE